MDPLLRLRCKAGHGAGELRETLRRLRSDDLVGLGKLFLRFFLLKILFFYFPFACSHIFPTMRLGGAIRRKNEKRVREQCKAIAAKITLFYHIRDIIILRE